LEQAQPAASADRVLPVKMTCPVMVPPGCHMIQVEVPPVLLD